MNTVTSETADGQLVLIMEKIAALAREQQLPSLLGDRVTGRANDSITGGRVAESLRRATQGEYIPSSTHYT